MQIKSNVIHFSSKLIHLLFFSDAFTKPIKMSQCGHSYCEKCLIACTRGETRWECPECRQINNCSAKDLPRNFALEHMLESIKNIEDRSSQNTGRGFCNRHKMAFKLRKQRELNDLVMTAKFCSMQIGKIHWKYRLDILNKNRILET